MRSTSNPSPQRAEYVARINRVIDYIEVHLGEELPLSRLAKVAYFSPFHFHRIFRAFVGETVGQFLRRVRLERAASRLVYSPDVPITEIALDCGFSGSETFARAFRDAFGMTASEWRAGGHRTAQGETAWGDAPTGGSPSDAECRDIMDGAPRQERKIGKLERKPDHTLRKQRQDFQLSSPYLDPITRNMKWRMSMKTNQEIQVEVKQMPEMHVAYVRHIGPYAGDDKLFRGLFEKLMKWAGPRGLLRFPETQMLSVYHDDPEVTEEEKLRVSVCITVPKGTPVEGEIGEMTIPAGQYAVGHFELLPSEFGDAWQALYGGWLPDSGYAPDERPCYELYLNDPNEHPEGKHIVEICIPVRAR
ncbi:MAG: helix-turn-helix domain-containing protein [Candidatus Eisenbacteria bacterium]|nr:helix-turn-helix domain-containing protein [Candidatus Eisenbacteria bacterium]